MIRRVVIDMYRCKRMIALRFLPGLILLVLGVHRVSAFGEEIPPLQPPVPDNVMLEAGGVPDNVILEEGAIPAMEGYIDRSHATVDRKINRVVAWFDGLFGDTAAGDSAKGDNKLKWANELRVEKGNSLAYRSSLSANLRLPKVEKKLRLVIMEETREEAVVPIPSEAGTPVVNTPAKANTLRAVNSELRFYARDTKAGYVFLAAGTRFVWPPETFVRARLLWRHTLAGNTVISPSVTPFWQDHIGFGATPQLDIGHPFPHRYIFLWSNSATVFENRSGFLWGSEVSLSRILSRVTAIAIAVGATGSTQPSVVADRFNMAVNNYRTSFKYRRSVYNQWLFLELIPEANWRREEAGGRELIPAFTVRLEINTLGPRALLPVPQIVKEQLPIPKYGNE
ncbi:MAG TPA: hypothetical protein VN450_05145 [Candidatus Methylomirabilis sp.]|nr:hypothetical protein [Candidatus Methylomirabilis sp.]